MAKEKKEAPSPEELAKLLAKKDAERNAAEGKPEGGRLKPGEKLGSTGLYTVDHSDPIFSNKLRK